MSECTEKWSEYFTCKECEDEVHWKGHVRKPKEAVDVKNFEKIFSFQKFINIKCQNMHRMLKTVLNFEK